MSNKLRGLTAGAVKWLKKPWEITGPVSGAEYIDPLPDAIDYRQHAPATQPKRVLVPHAEPEHVFDIKYYTRDRRRTPPTTKVEEVSPSEITMEGLAPTPGKWFVLGKEYHMNDTPGHGYQK